VQESWRAKRVRGSWASSSAVVVRLSPLAVIAAILAMFPITLTVAVTVAVTLALVRLPVSFTATLTVTVPTAGAGSSWYLGSGPGDGSGRCGTSRRGNLFIILLLLGRGCTVSRGGCRGGYRIR